jgi:hypothetical protein
VSTAIDAQVVLALATKASQVFVQDDTAFSVPLSPVVYRREDLERMVASDTAEGLRLLAEFSALVNTIGSSPVWSPTGDRYLWDVYTDVLADADLASASLTPDEEADRKRVAELLHAGGDRTDSPAYLAYRQCRDAWLIAQQEYNNRKGTAESSDDQAVKDAWAVDEPVLLEKLRECERKWAVDGRRTEIEEALRVERRLDERSPEKAWQDYVRLFDPATPNVFFANDTNVGRYVPSSLRPSNAMAVPWARMTLAREELGALADAAPAALRARFPATQDSAVDTLSFEYTSVAVGRPWFCPGALTSRAWRFSDATKILSDGAAEPHGLCPYYVAALVLARSITVTRRAAANGGQPAPAVNLGFLLLGQQSVPTVVREVRDHRILHKPVRPQVVEDPGVLHPKLAIAPGVLERLHANDFARVLPVAEVVPTPAPEPAPNSEATPPDEIYVLGFICKKLAKCPDPDPALKW